MLVNVWAVGGNTCGPMYGHLLVKCNGICYQRVTHGHQQKLKFSLTLTFLIKESKIKQLSVLKIQFHAMRYATDTYHVLQRYKQYYSCEQ